ncbi:MAG: transporter, partial [Kiritimatiellae bacterium]|nr:transporter [Kiritimatiellia bacterium]
GCIAFNQFLSINNMSEGASRFLTVKDDANARKAALMTLIGMIVCPIIWCVPALASAIVFPDLAEMYPDLVQPSEAAYVAICMKVMPQGLLGLLVCGIFAATMSSMDSGLNRSAGIFVKNFYAKFVNPQASDEELLSKSRVFSLIFGVTMILVAVLISRVRNLGLFDLVLIIGVTLIQPMIIPMFLGMFVKRVPKWSAWSTVVVGVCFGVLTRIIFKPEWWGMLAGQDHELTAREATDISFIANAVMVNLACFAWYFSTKLFYRKSSEQYKEQVKRFFKLLETPIDPVAEKMPCNDQQQYQVLGWLCIIYGGFVSLLSLIPNGLVGRMCFVFCGGVPMVIGLWLYAVSRKKSNTDICNNKDSSGDIKQGLSGNSPG